MSRTIHHVPLLVESSLKARTAGLGSKASLLSKMARSRVASVRNELIGDVRNVITGFLKDDRMKPSTRRCTDNGGVLARYW